MQVRNRHACSMSCGRNGTRQLEFGLLMRMIRYIAIEKRGNVWAHRSAATWTRTVRNGMRQLEEKITAVAQAPGYVAATMLAFKPRRGRDLSALLQLYRHVHLNWVHL